MTATITHRHVNPRPLPAGWATSTDRLPGAEILVRSVDLHAQDGPAAHLGLNVVASADAGSLTTTGPLVTLTAGDDEHGEHTIQLDAAAVELLVRELTDLLEAAA